MTSWLWRAAFVVALSPLVLFACTSNGAKANSPNCPAGIPASTDSCFRGDVDGGAISCTYACADRPGSTTLTCSPVGYPGGWSVSDGDCVSITPAAPVGNIVLPTTPAASAQAPSGPISCGNATCNGGEVCVHECCDITPCDPVQSDGGCGPGSHAVPENGGECQNGCIEDHPECLPSIQCETPPAGCTGPYCDLNCDG